MGLQLRTADLPAVPFPLPKMMPLVLVQASVQALVQAPSATSSGTAAATTANLAQPPAPPGSARGSYSTATAIRWLPEPAYGYNFQLKTDDGYAPLLCNLNGHWSTSHEKIVNGTPEHIQFFQRPGETNFTLRTTDWGNVLSYGHVVDATHADVFMVANPKGLPPITGNLLRWTISPKCDALGSSWCRFPTCPFKPPTRWPPWSPHPVPAPPAPPHPAPPPPPAPEKRITCGGGYGWSVSARAACPPPQWKPVWQMNLSTVTESAANISGFYDPVKASQWGVITMDWQDGAALWQDVLPGHTGEKVLIEQCKRIKAQGSGTRCMVYRQNELAVQWQQSSRAVMDQAHAVSHVSSL